jgi:hypothetical protein
MTCVARALVIVALVLAPGRAHAGGAVSPCIEGDPVLGYRHCGGFGKRWAHHWWQNVSFLDFAAVFTNVAIKGDTSRVVTVYSTYSALPYHLQLAPMANLHPSGKGVRWRAGFHGTWATAVFEATGVFFGDTQVTTSLVDNQMFPGSSSLLYPTDGAMYGVGGAVGVHTRSNRLTVGAEVALGRRGISIWEPGGYMRCASRVVETGCGGALEQERLYLEPRVRAEWWLTRELTVTATVGRDEIDGSETLAIGFTHHLSAYDGL